jgi:hypothetical protein
MTNEKEIKDMADFDLPEVDGPKATKRVHKGPDDTTCTSCEG